MSRNLPTYIPSFPPPPPPIIIPPSEVPLPPTSSSSSSNTTPPTAPSNYLTERNRFLLERRDTMRTLNDYAILNKDLILQYIDNMRRTDITIERCINNINDIVKSIDDRNILTNSMITNFLAHNYDVENSLNDSLQRPFHFLNDYLNNRNHRNTRESNENERVSNVSVNSSANISNSNSNSISNSNLSEPNVRVRSAVSSLRLPPINLSSGIRQRIRRFPSRINTNITEDVTDSEDNDVNIGVQTDNAETLENLSPVIVRPTPLQIIEATSRHLFRDISNDTIQYRCPIDCVDFEPEDIILRIDHCGHVFRERNIIEWFTMNVTCPLCRCDIREIPSRIGRFGQQNESRITRYRNNYIPLTPTNETLEIESMEENSDSDNF